MTGTRRPSLRIATRYLSVVLTVLAGALLTGMAVHHEIERSRNDFHRQLEWRSGSLTARFQHSLDRSLEVVDALGGLFSTSMQVSRAEFRMYVERPLREHTEFQALQWLPRTEHAERARTEAQLAQAKPGQGISERDGQGHLVPAGQRAEYFPVLYTEPYADNEAALGFDALSREAVRQTMEAARDSGNMAATEYLNIVQGNGKINAVILFRPVYRSGLPLDSVERRREALKGFGVGILRVGDILANALQGMPTAALDIYLLDRTASRGHPQLLHVHPSRSRPADQPLPSLKEVMGDVHYSLPIQVPGREWLLVFSPAPAFHAEFSRQHWAWILLAGALLTCLLAAYLLHRIREGDKLKSLTAELTRINADLARRSYRLDEAQRIANMGSWELEVNSGKAYWSDQEYRCLGYEPQQCTPSFDNLLAAVHPDDRKPVQDAVMATLRGQVPAYTQTHRVLWPDGSERIVHERGEVIRDAKGAPLRMLGTTLDITDSIRHEERLRLAAQVMDCTHDAVLITNTQGQILEVNPAFTVITGYQPEEAVGRNPSVWKSGRHDHAFYDSLWRNIRETGHWQGEIWNRRKSGEIYPAWQTISAVRDMTGKVTHYVSVFSDISGIVQSRMELAHLAQHDPLTELPNRLLFQDRLDHALQRARREGNQLAILFLDLDRFKHINDSLGHATGDRLLEEVARRLLRVVRKEDTVARMGGDEFIVLTEDLRNEQDSANLAEKLLNALSNPYRINDRELYITSSIGISLYPRDGTTAEALVRNADAAMYRAKAMGRNAYDFYTESLTDAAMERVQLEVELRKALKRGELSVHYQPQVDLASGRLVGAEALLRWRHPELGNIPPDRFIPLAEDTGLIIEIGEWVLREACLQAGRWIEAGLALDSIAVNVAGPQIQRSDFTATVQRVLDETGLPPERLELEVTEGFIMGQAESSISVLETLSRLGVNLSIDDFGTGYSSLAYLKRLPIDKLKLDRSFVRDLPADEEDAAIAAAVIALARSLGLKVIAEGVETAAQRDFLLSQHCDQAQGWYYGKAVAAEEFPFGLAPALAPVVSLRSVS